MHQRIRPNKQDMQNAQTFTASELLCDRCAIDQERYALTYKNDLGLRLDKAQQATRQGAKIAVAYTRLRSN